MDDLILTAKLHDDNNSVKVYLDQLHLLVKNEFSKKSINQVDYARFVNLLTCLFLKTDFIKDELENYLLKNAYRHFDKRI